MKLSEKNRIAMLTDVHKSIERAADQMTDGIYQGKLDQLVNYPPNGGLTDEEQSSLQLLRNNEVFRNALRKVFASNAASVLFELFNIIDGTADPDPDLGEWSGVMMIDIPENYDEHYEFLHDAFYETYQNWKDKGISKVDLELSDKK